jgi:hypothetical protein
MKSLFNKTLNKVLDKTICFNKVNQINFKLLESNNLNKILINKQLKILLDLPNKISLINNLLDNNSSLLIQINSIIKIEIINNTFEKINQKIESLKIFNLKKKN